MSNTDLNISNICQQRRRQLLFNVPPIRYNPVSPYSGNASITPFKLDMRRKAEILQYSANKSNTKTNNYTKANKWSLLVNGKNQPKQYNDIVLKEVHYVPSPIATDIYTSDDNGNVAIRNYSNRYSYVPIYTDVIVRFPDKYIENIDENGNITYQIIKGNIPYCNTDMIPTPTSSSDVPGSIINLVRDVTIPLYNYSTNTNSYGLINEEQTTNYSYIINKNIEMSNNTETTLLSLNIINNNDEYRNYFGFDIPLCIYFKSTIKNTNINDIIHFDNITITLTSVIVSVYYNNSTVQLVPLPNITLPSISTLTYDTSLNPTTIYEPFYSYNGQLYLGKLKVSDLYLYTQSGYIYDVKLKCNISVTYNNENLANSATYTTYFNSLQTTIICNPTDISKMNRNCSIDTSNSNETNSGFILYGY